MLEHEAQAGRAAAPPDRYRRDAEIARAVEGDLAAIGGIETRDQVQERALAAAGFSRQRHAFAGCDRKVDPRSTATSSPAER